MKIFEIKFCTGVFSAMVLAFGSLCAVEANGQQVCPTKRITLSEIRGIVLSAGRETPPVANTKVELLSVDGEELVVATEKTNSDGVFFFSDVSTGTYRLVVYFQVNGEEVAPKYDSVIIRARQNQRRKKELLRIVLSTNCHETRVNLYESS